MKKLLRVVALKRSVNPGVNRDAPLAKGGNHLGVFIPQGAPVKRPSEQHARQRLELCACPIGEWKRPGSSFEWQHLPPISGRSLHRMPHAGVDGANQLPAFVPRQTQLVEAAARLQDQRQFRSGVIHAPLRDNRGSSHGLHHLGQIAKAVSLELPPVGLGSSRKRRRQNNTNDSPTQHVVGPNPELQQQLGSFKRPWRHNVFPHPFDDIAAQQPRSKLTQQT